VADKADELDAASRRLVYSVVLSEDQGNFKFNAVELPDDAKARIDELVEQLKADPKGVYFEIEGHTDSSGTEDINERIGMERADAVKWYLYDTHQVPLHKINIISFGERRPAAPNTTREGRAQNRRVVIRVLA
jgi:peptidoglycan-associated lipoprotein